MRNMFSHVEIVAFYFSSVTPAKARAQLITSSVVESWIPAFAGMTGEGMGNGTSNISVFA